SSVMGRARQRHLSRAARARLGRALAPTPSPAGRRSADAERVVVELLSTLTLKQRRYVIRVLETGNARRSVLDAGYRCKNLRTADDIARELMSNPRVQHAFQGIVEARGLGTAKLDQILALHASRHSSRNGGDRDRSLRATIATYKHVLPKPAADAKSVPDTIIDEMTPEEQRRFAEHRIWPERFRNRLRATGASIHDSAPPTTAAGGPAAEREDRAAQAADDPPPAEAPSPARPSTLPGLDTVAHGACGDDDSGEDARIPNTSWAPASHHQPTSGSR